MPLLLLEILLERSQRNNTNNMPYNLRNNNHQSTHKPQRRLKIRKFTSRNSLAARSRKPIQLFSHKQIKCKSSQSKWNSWNSAWTRLRRASILGKRWSSWRPRQRGKRSWWRVKKRRRWGRRSKRSNRARGRNLQANPKQLSYVRTPLTR